jgi:hypothetical protein
VHTVVLLRLGLGVDVVAEVKHHVAGLQFVNAANSGLTRHVVGRGGGGGGGGAPADANRQRVELIGLVPGARGKAEVILLQRW